MNKTDIMALIKRFRDMRLPVMADELLNMIETNQYQELDALEVLERLTSEEFYSRRNNTINRLKKQAKLSQSNAHLEEVIYTPERQLNKQVMSQLKTYDYIKTHRNVILLGACGTGKSFIANALGNHACEGSYSTTYCRMYEFLDDCHQEFLLTQSIRRIIQKYSKVDVLIVDDFLVSSIQEKEAQYLFQLLEYRYGRKSTIICSQLEPSEWHRILGGSILADSILDRIIPNSYELVLHGESNR